MGLAAALALPWIRREQVSSLGSALERLPLLARVLPQAPPVAQPKPFAAASCAIRFRGMTIAWRDRQRRVLPCLLSLVRQTAERESRYKNRL